MTQSHGTRRALLRQAGTAILALSALPVAWAKRPASAAAPLRLVVIDLMPWAGYNGAGKMKGVSVELAQRLSVLSGLPITTQVVPYARAVAMLGAGDADLMLSIDTGRQSGLPVPLAAIGAEDVVVIGPRGTRYAGLTDLCGRTVGHMRRANFDPVFTAETCIVKYEINSYEQGVRMLLQGRLDAMMGVRSTMDYALKKLGTASDSVGEPLVLRQAGMALYVSERMAARADAPDLLERLRQACQQLDRDNALATLLVKHRQI
jgi:ABC-type amino acid transport substrate-binding protein